ncbi:VWA domain-containing protein [Entomobacter blattae]|uniref:Glutamine amidotransferase domain-containing protein n=1 Tax=Entomobacter blattae TaxID=2762277 RepID=A0A7H1NNC9_9PROT|nr:VWA domain-containing protein [Entomobacter blattae]QNT77289.1 hypothetical protein JGUZn3_00220 [Entomobacter blattae]
MTPDNLLHGSLMVAPLTPLWSIIALALCILLLTLWGVLTKKRGTFLRFVGMAIILLWLLNPQKLQETWHSLPETVLVVRDHSSSMTLDQRSTAAQTLSETIKPEQSSLLIRHLDVSSNTAAGTHIFEQIEKAFTSIPPAQRAGVVLLTDGQVHDVPSTLPSWLQQPNTSRGIGSPTHPLPFHVILTGKPGQIDRRIKILQAPPFVLTGQTAHIRLEVDDLGTQEATQTEITTQPTNGTAFSRLIRTGEPFDIDIPITQPGPLLISFSTPPLPGEIATSNNQAVVNITAIRDRLRVLLVSGTPNQGERVWRWLLKADPSVELIHFTILRPPEKDDDTPLSDLALIAFPVHELFQQKINSFDLIILDGFENRSILPAQYLENITRYVKQGGGLFLTAGPEFVTEWSLQDTSLSEIMPAHVPMQGSVLVRAFQPQLTPTGLLHPVTKDLPGANTLTTNKPQWGPWYRILAGNAQGEVLMEDADKHPLLVLNRVEKGRIAMLLSDQSWLWSRGEKGGGPQAELLKRISHWLMKEPELEEERLTATLADNTLTLHYSTLSSEKTLEAHVLSPNGKTFAVPLIRNNHHVLSGTLPAPTPGVWKATYEKHTAFAAHTEKDTEETQDFRATDKKLKPLVEKTNGQTLWVAPSEALKTPIRLALQGESLNQPKEGLNERTVFFPARNPHVVTARQTQPILSAWAMMPIILFLFLLAWYQERKS